MLARFAIDFGGEEAGVKAFDAYDQFLGVLADVDKRNRLKELDIDNANGDEVFQEARLIGNQFQDALTELFFHSDNDLTAAIQRYGGF